MGRQGRLQLPHPSLSQRLVIETYGPTSQLVTAVAAEKMLLYTRIAAPKVPRKRSRAGCNYCKNKKKKCDEVRPTCNRCQQHDQDCRYEPVKPRQRRKIEASNNDPSNQDPSEWLGESKRCLPAPTTWDSQLSLTRASTLLETEDPILWDTSEYIAAEHGRDSLGLFGQDLLPWSSNETQLLSESLDVPSNSDHSSSLALIAPAAALSPLFEFYAPAFEEFSDDHHHRRLFNHFCNSLSHLIVLKEDEGNPFQQLVLPLAHNCPAVKSAIFALASAHLEGNRVERMDNDERSIQFHSEAIRGLANLIEKDQDADKNELLATIILLVYYEVLVQRRRPNLVGGHLKGAMAIMRNGPSRNDQTGLFLERAFGFYDVIAALSSGTAPVSDHASRDSFRGLLEQTGSQGSSSPPNSVDALLGLATSLWPVIHRLSGLLALKNYIEESVSRGDFSGTTDLRARFGAECAAVESSLEEWQPMLPVDRDLQTNLKRSTANPGVRMRHLQSIFNTALAYRHSALVYLYRTIYDCPRGDPVVQHHTSISLVHCEATVRHEGPMGALLWPLFVASCEAVEPTDRDLASGAFRGIGQRQGMANIDRAWEVVQEVWNRADEMDEHSPEAIINPASAKKDLWRRVSEDMGMTIVFG